MKDRIEEQPADGNKAPTPEFLKEYIRRAVKSGEVAGTNPYKSSISTGKSGLAFGAMQNDTAKRTGNKMAQEYFRKILDADVAKKHLSKAKADTIYKAALKNPKSLSKADIELVDAALMRHQALVDEIDSKQLDNRIMPEVERALKAAEMNPNGPGELNRENPNLGFIAELAMWSNRSNGLEKSSIYISEMASITRSAWETEYLSKRHQFTKKVNPEDFSKWLKKVNRAIKDAEEGTRPRAKPAPGAVPTAEQIGAMHPYGGPKGSSGVVAYLIDGDSITLRFVDRPTLYVYDAQRPGPAAVREMQRLAKRGTGLTTYINQHIRKNYAQKIG
jgi:hypothetical protein